MARKLIWLIAPMFMVFLFCQDLLGQDKAEGKRSYLIYCSGCHGESGKGNGPAARSLPVKPANHADGTVMNQLSDKYLFDIIAKGGSAVDKSPFMPSWGSQLKEKQIRNIISHIRSLAVPPYKPSGK